MSNIAVQDLLEQVGLEGNNHPKEEVCLTVILKEVKLKLVENKKWLPRGV